MKQFEYSIFLKGRKDVIRVVLEDDQLSRDFMAGVARGKYSTERHDSGKWFHLDLTAIEALNLSIGQG